MKTAVCECDIGMGLEWSGNETYQEVSVIKVNELVHEVGMPSHSSGKFCSCDREGRCWRSCRTERGGIILFTTELIRGLFIDW